MADDAPGSNWPSASAARISRNIARSQGCLRSARCRRHRSPRRAGNAPSSSPTRNLPSRLDELARRQVGGERRRTSRPRWQPEERPDRRELRRDRIDHRLLPCTARSPSPTVEHVLADPRVDQRPLAVHAGCPSESPAGPLVATRLRGVGAVETIGPDRLRHVHVDPAERVDQILEVAEADHDDVVHLRPVKSRIVRSASSVPPIWNAALIFCVP